MENENLFKEIQAYPELNSPLNFFPIINHDLEKYNSKYRNAEKSKIFSSVLFGFDKNSNDSSLLSGFSLRPHCPVLAWVQERSMEPGPGKADA